MKKVLLDSDIIIECLRNNKKVIKRLKELRDTGNLLLHTPVSLAEIYAGIRKGEEEQIAKFFSNLNLISIDEKVGVKAGEYLHLYAKSHNVEIADALIAAAAFSEKSALYTNNRKHYPMTDIKFI